MEPDYLIFDEPLAHLDAAGSERVLEALRGVAAAGGAVLIAEQKTASLAEICDSVAVLDHGHLVMQGRPGDILSDPRTLAFGIEEPADRRIERLLAESGIAARSDTSGPRSDGATS